MHHVGVFRERIVLSHVVAQCKISIGGVSFRLINGIIEARFLTSAKRSPAIQYIVEATGWIQITPNHCRAHDSARIDHWVVGFAVFAERELVEIPTARLSTHVTVHVFGAIVFKSKTIGDRLAA